MCDRLDVSSTVECQILAERRLAVLRGEASRVIVVLISTVKLVVRSNWRFNTVKLAVLNRVDPTPLLWARKFFLFITTHRSHSFFFPEYFS